MTIRSLHPQPLGDGWVVDLRGSNKWEGIMNIFKRKPKEVPIKRYASSWFGTGNGEMSEQDYVDREFKRLDERIELLKEKTTALEIISPVDYIFICPKDGLEIKDEWLEPKEARVWAKKNNYSYVKPFKNHGELWVKREPIKKFDIRSDVPTVRYTDNGDKENE